MSKRVKSKISPNSNSGRELNDILKEMLFLVRKIYKQVEDDSIKLMAIDRIEANIQSIKSDMAELKMFIKENFDFDHEQRLQRLETAETR